MAVTFKLFLDKLYSDITDVPEILNVSYLPSLNGLRAISILFVVIGHLLSGSSDNYLVKIREIAPLGVYIFFVISGFLITTLLIKEKIKTGTISLTGFYKRRIFRIVPLAYLYPVVLFILNYVFHLQIPLLAFIGPFFFVYNIGLFNRSQYLGHYWSLSVEEQFYLIFPVIFKLNFKLYINFLLSLLLLVLVVRQCDFLSMKVTSPFLYRFQYLKEIIKSFDGIIIGSLLSIFTFKGFLPLEFFKKRKSLANFLVIFFIIVIHFRFVGFLNENFGSLLVSILVATLLINNVQQSKSSFFKFLNNEIVSYIGVMSYSIYIWQQLFTFTVNPPWAGHFKYSDTIWLNIVLLAVVAYVSYNFYEKQFLKLKNKKTVNKSG